MVRSWFTPVACGATIRVFTIFAVLILALAWSAPGALAQDKGGMQVEDLDDEAAPKAKKPAAEERLWEVTRPADKTVIPLDATLLYDSQAKDKEKAEPAKPEPVKPETKPEAKAETKPAPKAEAKTEPVKAQPVKTETKTEPKPQAKAEPAKAEPKPEPKAEAKPAKASGQAGPIKAAMDGTTLVITIPTTSPPGGVEFLTVFKPKRLALDLMGAWTQRGKANVLRLNNTQIKHVVVGEHPDKLRLVVHFAAENDTRPVTPKVERTDSGVTIRIPLD